MIAKPRKWGSCWGTAGTLHHAKCATGRLLHTNRARTFKLMFQLIVFLRQ